MLSSLYLLLKKPVRFDLLDRWLKTPNIVILDVGCGNHSASVTKRYFPQSLYYGLDKSKNYNNDEQDFEEMEDFYEIDLEDFEQLQKIPDNFFDCIILSHIIEHLRNGEDVILQLIKKLKRRGIIYIEFPSPHSVYLPSMKGTLNFHDDPSHVRLYSLKDLSSLLIQGNCKIIDARVRRSLKRIIFFPIYLARSLFIKGCQRAGIFQDLTGFASYIVASKENN